VSLVDIYENEIKPRIDYSKELADLEPVKKGEGRYLLICPSCNKKEAFIYENTEIIECNRKNNCGYKSTFLAYKNQGVYPRGVDYIKIIKELGHTYGIIIDDENRERFVKKEESRKSDQNILSKLWNHFQSLLAKSKGEEYLKSRNFPTDQKQFGMYPKVEELKRWITENKLDLDRCQDLGLIRHDFEGRLIGVWKTQDRDICNFWARSLDGKEPKYSRLKSHPDLKQEYPQGSEHILGDRSIWVEGHLDVVAAYLSVFDGVVGCGTATVPDKAFQSLKTSEVILCLDNDQAGRDGMYRFIEKHLNDDLKIFVAPIPHEDCKDLADVYEKYGEAAVHRLFDQHRLIHGMTFAADYIIEKHRGDNWNDYSKTQAVSELKNFSQKVSSENSWKLSEFFWPQVRKELVLSAEDIEAMDESIENQQQKRFSFDEMKEELEKKYPNIDPKVEEYFQEQLGIFSEKFDELSRKNQSEKVVSELKSTKKKIEDLYFSMQIDRDLIACLNKNYNEKSLNLALKKVTAYQYLRLEKEAIKLRSQIHSIENKNNEFTTNGQPVEAIIAEMNKKHAVFREMKDFLILLETHDGEIVFQKEPDFRKTYQDQIIGMKKGRPITKADLWLQHPLKRSYNRVVFDPEPKQNIVNIEDKDFNLWKGFAYEPIEGDVSIFSDFVKDIICCGNKDSFNYLWKWVARMFEKPHEVGATAIVLIGKQGTGKNTFVEILGNILGKHFSQLSSLEQLLGRFDFHHATSILIHANEALWGGDKRDVGKLKTLITEKYVTVEQKHRDPIALKNCRHIIFSSNEDWPIHLDKDDRRFFVLEISDQRKEDSGYFGKIWDWANHEKGYQKLIYAFQHLDIEGFKFRNIPQQTSRAFFVKMESAVSVEQYIYEALKEKTFRLHNNETTGAEWEEKPFAIDKNSLYQHYSLWCEREHIKQPQTSQKLSRALKKLIPSTSENRTRKSGTRTYLCFLPGVQQARAEFEKSYKAQGSGIWSDEVGTAVES